MKEQVNFLKIQLDSSTRQLGEAEELYMHSEPNRVRVQERISRCRDAADDLLKELQ